MRPLIMDFPEDSHVAKLGTQYMFGNAFLVAPVLEEEWTAGMSTYRKVSGMISDRGKGDWWRVP